MKNAFYIILILVLFISCSENLRKEIIYVEGVKENQTYYKPINIKIRKNINYKYKLYINGIEYSFFKDFFENGTHTILITAESKNSNQIIEKVIKIKIDSSPPIIITTGLNNKEIYYKPLVFDYKSIDKVKVEYFVNEKEINNINGYFEEGEKNIEIVFTKEKNNVVTKFKYNIFIDTTNKYLPEIFEKLNNKVFTDLFVITNKTDKEIYLDIYIDNIFLEDKLLIKDSRFYNVVLEIKLKDNNFNKKLELEFRYEDRYPEIPEIYGITEGGVYTGDIKISFTKNSDYEYVTKIDDKTFDTNFLFTSKNKEITQHVFYIEILNKINLKTKKHTVNFTIDNKEYDKPKVIPLDKSNLFIEPIKITLDKVDNKKYKLFIDDLPYIEGEIYDNEGNHILKIEVEDISGKKIQFYEFFKIDFSGIKEIKLLNFYFNKTYSSEVIIDVYREESYIYEAYINNEPFILGSNYSEFGNHTLIVNATNTKNNLTTKLEGVFEIDNFYPYLKNIATVKEGEVYTEDVKVIINKSEGVKYTFYLNKKSINNNYLLQKDGEYLLEIYAIKINNGLSSYKAIYFEIDKKIPEIKLKNDFENKKIFINPLYIDIKKEVGVEYKIFIDDIFYEKISNFNIQGEHILRIEALKDNNGLTNTFIREFIIDSKFEEEIEILGVENEKIYFEPLIVSIMENEKINYELFLNEKKVENHIEIFENDKYILTINAVKKTNQMEKNKNNSI